MEIDPMESVESKEDRGRDRASARLGAWVAITVALLATFLAICRVKDENISKAMERVETERLDHWNFYQARNIREEVASAALTQLRLGAAGAPAAQQTGYRDAITKYEALAADQNKKKEDLRVQADEAQKTYDQLHYRHDQFDLSDAMIALAISLLALTALTHKRGLFWIAMIPTAGGIVMGLAGLAGWHVHVATLSKLLS
jgi:hypothetical protein